MPRDQLFISYSHKDKRWRNELETQLKPHLRAGPITSWSDQQIAPGSQWFKEIESALVNSKIAVLLVSSDFLASDFIHERELGPLLKKAEEGGVKILWIPVRGSAYKQTPLKNYQAVSDPSRPLAGMTKAKRDQAWVEICEEIQKAVNSRAEVREPLDEPPPRQAKQPGLITGTDTAVAAEVLAGPELLAATEMSTLFVGSLSPHGKVVMKIVHESLPESDKWIASPPYKIAIGDRFLMDGTTKDGARYLVFQFIDGVSLGKVVRPGNVIRGALLDEIIMQLMRQLSVLNNASNQAVHRDVTPDNLLLTMEAAGPFVRLIDYESGCFSTASQNPVRNFGFTAPEQEIGRAIPSSDLYSLVSTVYFLATGEVTLRSGPSPPEFPAGTFGSLTEFDERYDFNEFLRCWSTEPEERPTSAAAFLSNTIRRGSRGIKNPVRLGTFACSPNLTFELFDMPKRLVDYLSAKSRSAQSMN